jgi:spermidine synthase
MKPRISLAETKLPDGTPLILEEHDGRVSLVSRGQQICGPATKSAEEELARLACAPFRPARQPKLWFAGLGLGHAIAAVCAELKQRRGTFIVAEPNPDIVTWHRTHLPESPLQSDDRITLENNCAPDGLRKHAGSLHAILIHLEAAPLSPVNRPWTDDRAWLAAAYDALQPGGLLAIAALRPVRGLTRRLHLAGFDVAEHSVPSSQQARRARMHPVWLARKGNRGQ